jgi:hypothetical protein
MMPRNLGTRHKPKWSGKVEYKGRQKWVGTYDSLEDNGRITMTWPDGESCEKETGRRESTVKRARDGLKPFIREFHDRPLDGFTRDEAVTWTRPKGTNTQQSVRQFFNHAVDRELIPRNLFTKLGASKKKRRVDRPDFEILSDEKYNRLLSCAREPYRRSRACDRGCSAMRWRDGDEARRGIRAASSRHSLEREHDPCALAD